MCETRSNVATVSVLTFNCWGIPLPFVCENYQIRMEAISNALFTTESKYDVICLQEIWGQSLFEKLQQDAAYSFPYSHYFYSGVLGSGVCVFSRWPIVEALFHKWQVNGYIHKITHGDWYGGKGVGLCRVNVDGFRVNIYTCHTHAEYSKIDSYITHKVVQSFDIAQFIHVSSRDADLTVLAADLNTEPGDLCYRLITDYTNLVDSFQAGSVPYEATFACPTNSFYERQCSPDKPIGERIDYILYRGGKNFKVKCVSYSTPLPNRIPHHKISFSDHEAVCAVFEIRRVDETGDAVDCSRRLTVCKKQAEDSIKDAFNICSKAEQKLKRKIRLIKFGFFGLPLVLPLVLYAINIFTPLSFILLLLFATVLTLLSLFLIVTIYLWLNIERNGILCASKEMKISLDHIQLLD